MLKRWFITFHGWLAVLFAVPLAIICVTGLILSFEPIVQYSAIERGTLNADEIVNYLKKHDPEGKARAITHRAYENSLTIDGAGPDGEVEIDLATRDVMGEDAASWNWSDVFRYNRRLHEHVTIAGLDVTIASTVAMLVIILLGILMGLPRIRNNIAGWHKAFAWFLLPALIISPLTGLFLPMGVSMNPNMAAAPARSAALPLIEAVQIAGKSHDLSNLIWLRSRGGRQMVRIWDGQEARSFAVSKEGLQPMPRNFSRIIHEGNFFGIWSGALMVITSIAFVVLMGTGVWLFGRKQLNKFRNRRARAARMAAAE